MSIYIFFLILHIFSAMFWIGGMMFFLIVVLVVFKKPKFAKEKNSLFFETAIAFRNISYYIFLTLFISGFFLLYEKRYLHLLVIPSNWTELKNIFLYIKIILFIFLIGLSTLHDFIIGPKVKRLLENNSNSYETYRKLANILGRMNFVISFAIVILGIFISRGILGI